MSKRRSILFMAGEGTIVFACRGKARNIFPVGAPHQFCTQPVLTKVGSDLIAWVEGVAQTVTDEGK